MKYKIIKIIAAVSLFTLFNIKPVQASVFFHGSRQKRQVVLTFDADMTEKMKKMLEVGKVNSWYNKKIIDILEKTNTKATLFLTGMWIELYRKEAESFAENPLFELGNHSYSHPSFHGRCFRLQQIKTDSEKEIQIQKTQKLLEEITHKKNQWFRFPGGCYSDNELKIAQKIGVSPVQWDVVSGDAFSYDPKRIVNHVISAAQNGSIIVMHLHGGPNAPKTDEALSLIIAALKKRGFEFVTLSELLH